jgi:DUF2911 family protein
MQLRLTAALLAVLLAALPAASQDTRGKAEATIKGKKVSIDYGRPALQGRDMIGMARPGTTWRLGMDDATEIQSTGTLVVAGKELKPGKYTLWAKKTSDTAWTLAFHPMTNVWGDPPLESGYVAQMPLKLEKVPASTEKLSITLADKAGEAAITVKWGTAQLTGTFGVK